MERARGTWSFFVRYHGPHDRKTAVRGAAAAMMCTEFIDSFSDYFDGVGDAEFLQAAESHLAGCENCRRYAEVVQRGRELVRSVSDVTVTQDFYPRLRHRIFHVEDSAALSRGSVGSATNAATILGMAVLLTLVAWSPMLLSEPEVELAPIVVSRPLPPRTFGLRPPPINFSRNAAALRYREGLSRELDELWQHPNILLLQHSGLLERYGRNGAFRLTGLD